VTLKQTNNSRGEQVLTTLPVADLTRTDSPSQLVFPQIAIGSGFSTRLILINRSASRATSGSLGFYRSEGSPMVIPLGTQSGSHFKYELLGGGGRQFLPGNTSPVSAITLVVQGSSASATEITVNEGRSVRPRLLVTDSTGRVRDDFDIAFTSLDADVATVDTTGEIRGKKAGFSTLTLSSGDVVAAATVVVVAVTASTGGFEISGVAQDPGRKLYLVNSTDNTILLAQDIKQAPSVYAGVPRSAGLRNDLRLQSLFRGPAYVALHQAQGSLYVSDSSNNVIRRVQPGPAGKLETLAGTSAAGSRDGAVAESTFRSPQGVALDNRGYLWVVDSANHTVRRINLTSRTVETVAGKAGTSGWTDGKRDAALFSAPVGIAVEIEPEALALERERRGLPPPPVSVIIADTGNGVLRRVKDTGEVETIRTSAPAAPGEAAFSVRARRAAGPPAAFSSPTGVAVDPAGNIYVTETGNNRVRTVLSTGEIVEAAQDKTFNGPRGIAISQAGKVVIGERSRSAQELAYGAPEIRSITPDHISIRGGTTVTISGNNFSSDTLVVAGGVVIAQPVIRDTRTITFVAPSLASGRGTVSVENRGGLAQAALLIDAVPLKQLAAGEITTVAGGTTYVGDGSSATSAIIRNPGSTAVDSAGNLYIADFSDNRIRRVDARTGTILTVAGTGRFGYSGDGGPATAATLASANDVALDSAGNLYICDTFNCRVRKVSAATGIITTVAGRSDYGYSGDGGPATEAVLNFPLGIAIDSSDNLWIADSTNNAIRKVDATTGKIATVAGTGTAGFSGDNGPALSARFNHPYSLTVDGGGNAYVADYQNQRVRKIAAATGIVTTVAGNGTLGLTGDGGLATLATLYYPTGVAVDTSGNLLISHIGLVRRVASDTGIISTVAGTGFLDFSGDGRPATEANIAVVAVSVDAADNLFVSDYINGRIRRVDAATRIVSTVAGNGDQGLGDKGPASAAILYYPYGIAIDADSNLYIADTFNSRIRKVAAATGIITTVAGSGAFGPSGDGGAATQAQLEYPRDVAVDVAGNLFITDTLNNRIRKVTAATGVIDTVAGSGDEGFSGDGGPAKSAALQQPHGAVLDRAGNIYIADTLNHRIRKVTASTGVITTVAGTGVEGFSGDGGAATAARIAQPDSVMVDSAGNLYIADTYNHRVRKVDVATGIITTVAGNGTRGFSGEGGPAISASMRYPSGVALDSAGNLYVADSFNSIIRRVSRSGIITTIAGNGTYGYTGDSGRATAASLYVPTRVVFDPDGNLIFPDSIGDRVRAVRGPVP
jgi:sugar lactone lactonase YvrE